MKQKEFYLEFKKLCKYYNSNIYKDEYITSIYFEKVRKYSVDVFKNKCRELILKDKFMPKVAEFSSDSFIKIHDNQYTETFFNQFYDIGGKDYE